MLKQSVLRVLLIAAALLLLGGGKKLGELEPIYLEDHDQRYLRIDRGDAGVVRTHPAKVKHRDDLRLARYINGDVRFLFETLYGWDKPRIVVETRNRNGYAVTFDGYDDEAIQIVARELDLAISMEFREIYALVITRTIKPLKMEKVEKPEEPFEPLAKREGWPIKAMSMDEVAQFLEGRYRRPVVNATGIDGYYTFIFSNDAAKMWPQTIEEVKKLDDTGLQIKWEKKKIEVLVIKDKPQPDENNNH